MRQAKTGGPAVRRAFAPRTVWVTQLGTVDIAIDGGFPGLNLRKDLERLPAWRSELNSNSRFR